MFSIIFEGFPDCSLMVTPFSIPTNRAQKFHFSASLPTSVIFLISPFVLVSISLILSDAGASLVAERVKCLPAMRETWVQSVCLQWGRPGFNSWVKKNLWRRKWQLTLVLLPRKFHGWRSTFPMHIGNFYVFYEVMSTEDFYTFFKGSNLPAVVLQLNGSSCLFTLDIGPSFRYEVCRYFFSFYRLPSYWLLKRVSILHLVILETWQRSFGHTCVNLFKIPSLRFIALSAYFVAGRIPFWLLWNSYLFWIQEAWRPHCCSFLLRLFSLGFFWVT